MNTSNIIKKYLTQFLIGFSVGITLLMISYVSIYFLSNENTFNTELDQLHNINTFIFQMVSGGTSGSLLFVLYYTLQVIQEKFYKRPYKLVFLDIIITTFTFILVLTLISNSLIFSKNVSTTNIVIVISLFAIGGFIFCIKTTYQSLLVHKINKKLNN